MQAPVAEPCLTGHTCIPLYFIGLANGRRACVDVLKRNVTAVALPNARHLDLKGWLIN